MRGKTSLAWVRKVCAGARGRAGATDPCWTRPPHQLVLPNQRSSPGGDSWQRAAHCEYRDAVPGCRLRPRHPLTVVALCKEHKSGTFAFAALRFYVRGDSVPGSLRVPLPQASLRNGTALLRAREEAPAGK